ncbi:MAG: DUF2510 domain-containing protein, partial [Actinomycetia bacterium]|nr:DUF2510 domain-containing protein [Actinomycetes bacterium]
MSEPPPPSPHQPPPGWYHDPQSGGRGFRWWDGTTWTEKRSDHPDAR